MEGSKSITRRVQRLVRRLPDRVSGPLIRNGLHFDPEKTDDICFKIAESREELEAAYRLVHDVYVREGYSDPHDSGLRVNLRYALPTTTTFIGTHEGRVVITMTILGDSPLGLPMDMIFSSELYELRCQGRYIAEVGAFASHPDFRGRSQAVAFNTNKIMWTYATRSLQVDDLVIAVNPKHERIYKHLILFETISTDVKSSHYVKDAPAIAMRLNLRTVVNRWKKHYGGRPPHKNLLHFFFAEDPKHISLPNIDEPYNVWDEEMFSYFFEHMTDPRREGHGSLLDLYRMLYTLDGGQTAYGESTVTPFSFDPKGRQQVVHG
jgi:hypothetical protein